MQEYMNRPLTGNKFLCPIRPFKKILTYLVPNLQGKWFESLAHIKYRNMKSFLLFILFGVAVSGNAQSLKDALYGGKLKLDTGKVLKQSDDWKSKIDTTTKKPVERVNAKIVTPISDSSMTDLAIIVDSATGKTDTPKDNTVVLKEGDNSAPKDNNKLWKDYIDELTGTLRTEVMPSKKIKSGTYSVLIEYEIGLDGQVTATSVSSSPENSFIEQQVKERITLTAPQMTPLLNNYGKPRKALKKQVIALSK